MNFVTGTIGTVLAGASLLALATSVASAGPTVPIAEAKSRDAIQSQLGASNHFGIILHNSTDSALTIYTEVGPDWDVAAGNPFPGKKIYQGDEASLFLYNQAGGVDAVGLNSTRGDGTIGISISQNSTGGHSIDPVLPKTLNFSVSSNSDGEDVVTITN